MRKKSVVSYAIPFYPHKSGIGIGFAVAVADVFAYPNLLGIFPKAHFDPIVPFAPADFSIR